MTGFDETVPPADDPDRDENAVATPPGPDEAGHEQDGPEIDADEEQTPDPRDGAPFGGDDDIASGQVSPGSG